MMKIYDKKLAYPYFVWMTLFTVVPLFIVGYYALTDSEGHFTLDNLVSISGYSSVFARSLLLALIATVICLVIAFPVGYFLSRLRVNKQHIMLMLVMLPMWMNFLLRTYAWMGLLSVNGPVNAVLGLFGLGPYTMLNTSGAVVLGMVYNYVPYMILPLYTSKMCIRDRVNRMKQGIHPNYVDCTITCACGNVIKTRSTKPEIHVEVCSKCHPFYTGKQKLVDTGGRVERFNKRFGRK